MEQNSVSTFSWDTTYTTTYRQVNDSIIKYASSPAGFNNQTNAFELLNYLRGENDLSLSTFLESKLRANTAITLQGEWGKWQLHLKGNGNTIYLKLPVKTGKISFGADEGKLDGGYLIVSVCLKIETPSPAKKEVVLAHNEEKQVVVTHHDFPQLDEESDLAILVDGAFKKYFNTQKVLNEFRHVFSTVDINRKATGDFAWLTPSDTSYAVFAPEKAPGVDNSLFSILCMTENRTAPSSIQSSVDASVFDGKTVYEKNGKKYTTNAVLCISGQRFCQKFLIESAKKMLKGTTDADYAYSTDGSEIHNVREITFKDVEVNKGDIVDLKIKALDFSIQIVNDHLKVTISDASYSTTLYTVYLNFDQRIEFEVKREGGKTIFIPKSGEAFKGRAHASVVPTQTAEILKWVGVALDILSAVTLISAGTMKLIAKCGTTAAAASAEVTNAAVSTEEVVAATAVVADGLRTGSTVTKSVMIANRLLAAGTFCGLLGLPFSLVETISADIGEGKFEKVPTLESFAKNFLGKIQWTGVDNTTVLGARLNGAFLLDFLMNDTIV